MMQPYRLAGGDAKFGRTQLAQHLCQNDNCDAPAEIQYRRHATTAEYDAIGEGLKPIDGVAHQAVFVCGDHEPDSICSGDDHAAPAAQGPGALPDCPECQAAAGESCRKANGKPRSVPHQARSPESTLTVAAVCNHVHREDCGGIGHCRCSPDDPPPPRPKRDLNHA